jgi:phosphate starvation-inducible PhoH-like protein
MQMSVTKERNSKKRSDNLAKPAPRAAKNPTNKDHLSLKEAFNPLTEGQRQMMYALQEGMNVVAYGSAGTGKSFVAVAHALEALFSKRTKKIVIVRSAVQSRDMGFLPGSLDEKADPYKIPYKQLINQMCGNGTAWDVLVKKEMIEFITTSYVRGITLDDSIIILDEYQNCTQQECYSVLSRLGIDSQIILLGDTRQTDLNKRKEESCFDWVINVAQKMPTWFDMVHFRPQDIVRSNFVKDLILTVEEMA